MRNSASGFLFRLLLAAGLVIVVLTLVPGVWLVLISSLLKANQSAGLPQFSATPVSGFTSSVYFGPSLEGSFPSSFLGLGSRSIGSTFMI